ncbi:MAG: single-stranded-DNA-specific exonuclease RecJ [Acidobacteria bacterium]|nr:single-stranded-DNA-specific exonuclease RecJ [Acidobacteriota bacterium]
MYKWSLKKFDPELVSKLTTEKKIPEFIAKLLVIRGIDSPEKVDRFFNGTMENLHDPFLMNGMEEAVTRILDAVKQHEKIMIYGDYDVDGISAIVILKQFLTEAGGDVSYTLPNRFKDGYGVKVEKLLEERKTFPFKLVITVDCGIKAVEEVNELAAKGIDVIITDHHEPDRELPKKAVAILNPKVPGSGFETEPLAGVGVVFKLVQALSIRTSLEESLDFALKIVSIGTVADLVPLLSENRILVKEGLKAIQKTTTRGLEAMIESCNIDRSNMASVDISYKIAPRINALGRLGDASNAIEMFTTNTETDAREYAKYMNRKNAERQRLEKTLETMVMHQIEQEDMENTRFLLLSGTDWHKGVIGIVASKIQKRHYRPVGIVSIEGDMAFGSIRSIDGINIIDVLENFESLLTSYGGHQQAAGITLKKENLDSLKTGVNEYLFNHFPDEFFTPKIEIDCEVEFSLIDDAFYEQLKQVEPFGIGNPQPVFLVRDVIIETEPELINNRHIKFEASDGLHRFEVIGYNKSHLAEKIQKFDSADIVFSVEKVRWNHRMYFQLNLVDLRRR